MVTIPPPDFEVSYRAVGFPAGTVPRNGTLRFSPDDLAHALFVTGRAPGDQKLYGAASVWEWLHRVSLIPAYVRRNYSGELVRSRLALDLDRSELAGFSYALGQAMTGVFCRSELSVTHLMHIDRYASQHGVVYGQTRKRADLFGLARHRWVVAEAKGRSRSMEPTLRQKLIAQKRSIRSIEGVPPWLALGCVASFPIPTAAMRIDAFDPEEDSEDAIELEVTSDGYMLAYYLPLLNAIDLGESEEDRNQLTALPQGRGRFVSARFGAFGVRVALLRSVADRVRRAATGELEGLHAELQALLTDGLSREVGMFPDGTIVETNWNESLAVSDWEG